MPGQQGPPGAALSAIARDVAGETPRPAAFAEVPAADWTSWRWQQRNRLRAVADLERVIELTSGERDAFEATSGRFRVAVTPYYAALMDPVDPACPVRRQAVPSAAELTVGPWDRQDPLGEERFLVAPGLTHRYPDRALWYVTHNCPVYCRHCTRKRKVADPTSATSRPQWDAALAYLASHPEVRDVLVSGGDPLSLSDDRLLAVVSALRRIPHIEVIRLCTRNPVTLPFRFTEDLVRRLASLGPLFVHTHFNHPRECTPEAARCLRRLADAGLSTANQMVLLSGINDDVATVKRVNHWVLRQRCRPYYLFQADLAEGIGHFRTPIQVGLDIIAALRGHTSGMAVPHYVVDAPGGGGKVALLPDAVVGRADGVLTVRNYQGKLFEYPLA